MAETELREHIVVDGAEAAESKLGRLAGVAGRVAHAFEGITEIAGALGGVAGAWKLAEGIEETNQLYGAVARVAQVNRIAAAEAHGLFDVFEMAGVDMESAETVMTSMARMAGKIGGSIAVSGEEAKKLRDMMQGLGVDAKSGIVEQMMQMSKSAQQGKIGLQDLTTVFGVGRRQAQSMMILLQQGPERIRQIMEETKKSAGVIDDAAIQHFQELQQTRRELGQAWQDISLVLYKSLAPAVTEILKTIKSTFEDITPIAQKIGKFLADHMHTVVALTKTWLALMATNKVLNMFGGEGGAKSLLGGEGRLKQLFEIGTGFLGKTKFAKAGAMDFFEAKEAFGGVGMFGNAGGMIGRILGSSIGRLGVLGAAIMVIVKAIQMVVSNTDGIRDRFMKLLKSIWESLAKIYEAVKPLIDLVGKIVGGAIYIAAKALLAVMEYTLTVIAAVAKVLAWIIDKANQAGLLFGAASIFFKKSNAQGEAKKAVDEATRGTGAGKGATINQDFRNSKFEITNNFPEGIDGGRVAVAFGDELAALGERRLDSGLRPLFSYR